MRAIVYLVLYLLTSNGIWVLLIVPRIQCANSCCIDRISSMQCEIKQKRQLAMVLTNGSPVFRRHLTHPQSGHVFRRASFAQVGQTKSSNGSVTAFMLSMVGVFCRFLPAVITIRGQGLLRFFAAVYKCTKTVDLSLTL